MPSKVFKRRTSLFGFRFAFDKFYYRFRGQASLHFGTEVRVVYSGKLSDDEFGVETCNARVNFVSNHFVDEGFLADVPEWWVIQDSV
ncbi:uncharacterized protein BDZ99DRAFT_459084 [Mytilinidion resinicola]|uniref:Uncharacterized protein n=1 Tax=Mytilinidion resinicola TaxID=574789 RepID=A0A6A6Z4P3_9PEZI|nr:uncharacterized protein BDZ99DRAFT_459084 [Mytilinidion resinicola]KAF2815145.1 hypothetical protein BDZ99DRAFT_459084 [Mytilinidion resinicola]